MCSKFLDRLLFELSCKAHAHRHRCTHPRTHTDTHTNTHTQTHTDSDEYSIVVCVCVFALEKKSIYEHEIGIHCII